MADNEFIGLNTAGVPNLIKALDDYINAINAVGFTSTATETQVFAKGSPSCDTMLTMFENTDDELEKFVDTKLTPLKTKFQELNTQFKSNNGLKTETMESRPKSILKS